MAGFEYLALDDRGRTRSGVLDGETPRHVRQQLRDRGLFPFSIEQVSESTPRRGRTRRRRGVSAAEFAVLARQLATLVRAGLALEEVLQTVARQTRRERLKRVLMGVRSRVMEGHSLADGLRDFPQVFPELYRATVAAGEQSGHLDLALERLADHVERRQQLRQKVMMALLYPTILTGVAILVVAGLLGYVVPQVTQVFEGIGQELPWLTRTLIGISDFMREFGLLLLGIMVSAAVGFPYLLRIERVRTAMHSTILKLPLISGLVRGLNTARFAGTLAVLLASAVPLLEALRIASSVLTNWPMRRAVEEAARKVSEGTSLHAALERSGVFSPVTVQLIASGEASGSLERMLERASESQQRELETVTGTLLAAFEPLLILIMGGVVLLIVLAILLPIFELNQLVA